VFCIRISSRDRSIYLHQTTEIYVDIKEKKRKNITIHVYEKYYFQQYLGENWVSLGRYTKSYHSIPTTFRHVSPRAVFRWTDARILKQRDGFRGTNFVPLCSLIYCLTQKYEILHHKPTREEEIYKRLIHPWAPVIAVFRPNCFIVVRDTCCNRVICVFYAAFVSQ